MNAAEKTQAIAKRFAYRGISISQDDVNTLRRAAMTLHRWSELECGNGDNYKSWSIERDEQTNLPYMCIYPHQDSMLRYRVPDREQGALKRIQKLCKRLSLHYYHQTDPRGCSLYVSNQPITDTDYQNGIACCE